MSLYSAMYSGVSGLSAQSKSLGVISENIANVNTIGYKAGRTDFETLVTGNRLQGSSGSSGVRADGRSLVNQQGLLQTTESSTDIAISGDGFFVVNSQVGPNGRASGEYMFTRAGSFELDSNKNLVNTAGFYLLGWELNASGAFVNGGGAVINPDPTSTSDLQMVSLHGIDYAAEPTRNVSLNANLSNAAKLGDVYTTNIRIFDVTGGSHHASFDWEKADAASLSGSLDHTGGAVGDTLSVNMPDGGMADLTFAYTPNAAQDWTVTPSITGGTITSGTIDLAFDADGNLLSPPQPEISIVWDSGATSTILLDLAGLTEVGAGGSALSSALNPDGASFKLTVETDDPADTVTNGASTRVLFDAYGMLKSPADHSFSIDWDDSDTFAADSTIALKLGTPGRGDGMTNLAGQNSVSSVAQDGLAFGAFSGVIVDEHGIVTALFDNGQSRPAFKIPVARFNNPNGLVAQSGNVWLQSPESGSFFLNESGVGGAGRINARSLEASTVDLASEFTNMITTQRAYSANATLITTADEMLEELSRLKR